MGREEEGSEKERERGVGKRKKGLDVREFY